MHEPTLVGIKPSFGASMGGSVVTVQGRHFITSSGSRIDCVFGGITRVEGVVVSSEEVLCVSPANEEGAVSLALDVRGSGAILSSSFKFMYDPPLLATSFWPQRVASGKSLSITVAGDAFSLGRSLVCVFGGMYVRESTYISSTQITCPVPEKLVGNSTVEVGFEGGTSEPALVGVVQMDEPSRIVSVMPSFGPLGGKTRVRFPTLLQSGTPPPASLKCMFGVEVVAGEVDSEIATCTSPARAAYVRSLTGT